MARKKKHEEHENLERWLVSYADFITLLFAVFVVLYALSQLDLAKFKDLKISLAEAFAPTLIQGKGSKSALLDKAGEKVLNENKQGDDVNILPPINPQLELKKEQEVKEELQKAIEKGDLKGVSIKVDKRGLVISLVDSIFFDSGSANLKDKSKTILQKVAFTIKKEFPGNKIRIEGHTDSDPIHTGAFPSNWELSAARASSVVRYFISDFKMDKQAFSAVGYADAIPIAPNDNSQNKQKNRRVEIVILNSKTSEQEASGTGEEGTASTDQNTGTPKDDNIEIIKGGSKKAKITDVETEKENQSETPTNEELNTKQPPLAENNSEYKPIELPVSKEPPKPATEVLEVESKRYH